MNTCLFKLHFLNGIIADKVAHLSKYVTVGPSS